MMTDDDIMRGLIAAFYLQGGRALCQIQTPPDAVDVYIGSIPLGYQLIDKAELAGYIETITASPGYENGTYVVTEAGKEFFLRGEI